MAKISKRGKEILRDKLYKRDGRRCHYCRIKEEDFIRIWGPFYDGKTGGKKLEIDRGRIIKKAIPKKTAL